MKSCLPVVILISQALLVAGCRSHVEPSAQSNLEKDFSTIQMISQDYQNTLNAGDATGFANLHTKDTIRILVAKGRAILGWTSASGVGPPYAVREERSRMQDH